ncbi:hypothetical protein Tco_0300517 [Tanacetum coccineum]
MANLEFCDKHNMVAYLEKSEGSEGFHEIIDFLSASHIHYALTASPTIYTSLIEQFWQTAALCIIDDGVMGIKATIDRKVKITVSEASVRRHLKLEDSEGIPSLPTIEIFEQLALTGTYPTLSPIHKLFNNMKRVSKGYSEVITPAFDTMLVQHQGEEPSIQTTPKTSPSKITSSPSLSSHHTSISAPSTLQPPITPTEEAAPMPHESPIHSVHSLGCDEVSMQQNELMDLVTKLSERVIVLETDIQQTKKVYSFAITKLILRVKKLEKTVKTTKAKRRARVVLSDDEDAAEDSSKQGRKISDIDTDPTISLVQPQQDMEYDFDVTASIPVTTAGLEISTANIAVSTANAAVTTTSASISTVSPLRVSTAKDISGSETLVYIRRSASKAKDKGKAIMQESEPSKKIKKRVQVQMSVDEELAKKVFEEEQAKFKAEQEQEKSDFETALELQKKLDEREEVEGYKLSHFKGMKYEDIRPIFERVWDQNQAFVPKDSEIEKEQPTRGSRKKSLARKRARETLSKESAKKQKLEDDTEKEELQVFLNIVPEEESLDIESLATKQDVLELYRLVKERFQTASPKGYDLLLLGDLKTMIDPNEEDEI